MDEFFYTHDYEQVAFLYLLHNGRHDMPDFVIRQPIATDPANIRYL